ncbi:MAG: hypothetical protein IPK13_13455 [Deltaproteobacteria bacterium]|nr:hypothetical protein [Deltaproteobacteria bacterium]
MAIRATAMTLDLDVTYIFVLALLAVPLILLNHLVFRPFMALFAERHERLEGAFGRAESLLVKAEQRAQDFSDRIQVATSEGIAARTRIRSEATEAMTRRVDEERQRLRDKVEAAVKEIEASAEAALVRAHEDAQRLAQQTAEKMLGRRIES